MKKNVEIIIYIFVIFTCIILFLIIYYYLIITIKKIQINIDYDKLLFLF